jgi:hypothetical protein
MGTEVSMSGQDDGSAWKSSARGESAWKEAREQVALSNEAGRKSGKRVREAYQREREEVRRAAEARRHAKLLGRDRSP